LVIWVKSRYNTSKFSSLFSSNIHLPKKWTFSRCRTSNSFSLEALNLLK
jgi:hypothetical protein